MILQFHLSVDPETIKVSVPEVGLAEEMRAVVGVNTRSRQIVAVGESAEEVQGKAPDYWAKHGHEIAFVRPFDLASVEPEVGGYKPLVAARLVQWYAGRAAGQWRRTGFFRQLVGPFVDSIDYHLEIASFERLDEARRRDFVNRLRQLLPAIHRVYVNGEKLIGR